MRSRPLLCLALGAAPVLASDPAPRRETPPAPVRAEYTVTITDPERELVRVHARFEGLGAGEEEGGGATVSLPESFSFVSLPGPLLEAAPRAWDGSGAELAVEERTPFVWEVPRAADRFTFEFTVRLTHRRQPQVVAANDFHGNPYLASDHGMLVAGAILPALHDADDVHCTVRFDLPEGWQVTSAWPRDEEGAFHPTAEELQNDYIAVGGWSLHAFRAGDADVTLAFAPGQENVEEACVEVLEDVVVAEQALFGLTPQPRYLFLFGRPDGPGFGGSPQSSSMTLMLGQQLPPDLMRLHVGHLVAHEYHHTWNRVRFRCPDELRFFNEGFTDYFAWLLLSRLGYADWQAFADKLAETLTQLEQNPAARTTSLAEAGGPTFFTDRDHYALTYGGGLITAAWLDRVLRNTGEHTLDDLMRRFNNDERWSRTDPSPSLQDLTDTVAALAGDEHARTFHDLVTRPFATFDPATRLTAAAAPVTRKLVPPHLGLRANMKGTTLTAIDPTDLAHTLGLRPGDRLIKVNGQPVTTEPEARKAWRTPKDNRFRLEYDRDGQTQKLDVELEDEPHYTVDPEPWRAHAVG